MSGWIRAEKQLTDTIRFKRMVKAYRNALRGVTDRDVTRDETLLLGALIRLWMYADSHIRDDNTLVITCDEIDEIVGVAGFANSLPTEWLVVLDSERVELPDFLEHNGTSARQRKNNAARQASFRSRKKEIGVTRDVTHGNARNDARPDQTRLEEKRLEKNSLASATPTDVSRGTSDWFIAFKLAYPERAGDQGWRKAQKAANARLAEGHSPREFIEGAARYEAWCRSTEKLGTEFVKQAATFLGPDKPFLLPWTPPPGKNQLRQDANIAASHEWLEKTNAA
jgi:hypothetical protein